MTVVSTARGTDSREDGWHTEEVSVSHETLPAETFVGVGVTGSVQTTGGRVTPLPTLSGHAGEGLRAGDGGGTGLGHTAPSGERITQGSLTTGTGGALRSDDALSVDPTDHALTHGGALALLVLSVADLAPAPGRVVLGDADGVLPAGDGGAGVDTGGGLAGQLSGAVRVSGALHSGGSSHTTGQVGISSGPLRTLTLVAPVLVDTASLGSTGVAQALVYVSTASDGISTVSSLTETLRRVGRGTVGVDPTLEPLTGTLALPPVSRVREERRRTDALAGLHTLLVRPAVSVSATLDLVGRADSVVRISSGSQGTDTAEGAHLVLTERPEATRSGG